MANPKIVLTELQIQLLREHAYKQGYSVEWFEQWLDDCVELLEPLPPTFSERLKKITDSLWFLFGAFVVIYLFGSAFLGNWD